MLLIQLVAAFVTSHEYFSSVLSLRVLFQIKCKTGTLGRVLLIPVLLNKKSPGGTVMLWPVYCIICLVFGVHLNSCILTQTVVYWCVCAVE